MVTLCSVLKNVVLLIHCVASFTLRRLRCFVLFHSVVIITADYLYCIGAIVCCVTVLISVALQNCYIKFT